MPSIILSYIATTCKYSYALHFSGPRPGFAQKVHPLHAHVGLGASKEGRPHVFWNHEFRVLLAYAIYLRELGNLHI